VLFVMQQALLKPGSVKDTTIVLEFFTAPVTMTFNLNDLGKCPQCGDLPTSIHFEAAPGPR